MSDQDEERGPVPSDITVEEFARITKDDLDAFARWWRAQRKRNPEHFPERLGEGEIWEQFIGLDHGQLRDELAEMEAEDHVTEAQASTATTGRKLSR